MLLCEIVTWTPIEISAKKQGFHSKFRDGLCLVQWVDRSHQKTDRMFKTSFNEKHHNLKNKIISVLKIL